MSSSSALALLLCQVVAGCGLGAVYLGSAFAVWSGDPPGSAANFTALLGAVAMAGLRLDRLRVGAPGRPAITVVAFAAALALFSIGHQLDLLFVAGLGLVGVIAALLHQERGTRGLRAMRLPLVLLLLSLPVPGRLLVPLTGWFLDATLLGAQATLRAIGMAPVSSGYTLSMPGGTVTLVADCSGLDGTLLFVPLALLLLEANRPMRTGYYVVGLLLIVPVAYLANLLRVVIESVLVTLGAGTGEGTYAHDALGIVLLLASLTALWLLGRAGHNALRRSAAA